MLGTAVRAVRSARPACRRSLSTAAQDSLGPVARFLSAKDGNPYFGQPSEDKSTATIYQRDASGSMQLTGDVHEIDSFLPPLEPATVFAIGLNYGAHAKEAGKEHPNKYPVVLLKAATSTTGHDQFIVIPRVCQERPEVDFEGELAVVIGKEARDVPPEDALDHVLGYTIANDVSARRWQGQKKGGGQWVRAKSFDTFCPLGPALVPKSMIPDPQRLDITTTLNGEVMQSASTSDMIHSVADIVSFLSQGTTLQPGTVILTGTPEGVGYARQPPVYLKRGDVVEVSITGLGTLRNRVAEEVESSGGVELRV